MKNAKLNFTVPVNIAVKAIDEKSAIARLSSMLKRNRFDVFAINGKITSEALPVKAKAIKEAKPAKIKTEKIVKEKTVKAVKEVKKSSGKPEAKKTEKKPVAKLNVSIGLNH
jgi:hypothetical protein